MSSEAGEVQSLRLAQLEDVLYVLGLTTAQRSRGRKPSGYCPITTTEQAVHFLMDTRLNSYVGKRAELVPIFP